MLRAIISILKLPEKTHGCILEHSQGDSKDLANSLDIVKYPKGDILLTVYLKTIQQWN